MLAPTPPPRAHLSAAAVALCAALIMTACGGGGGIFPPPQPGPESLSLAPKAIITDDDIRHFLDRTHFGFSQVHYDAITQMGFAAYIDAMTSYVDTTTLETDAHNAHLVDANDPTGEFPSAGQLAQWWLYMIMRNQNPFQENLALHWHEHFATSTTVLSGSNTHYFVPHVNLWRHGGTGNLRTLLIDMARDSAMLVWLDGISNVDGEPNENFGREFLELFCLGVDIEYTQADIEEAAPRLHGLPPAVRFRYGQELH